MPTHAEKRHLPYSQKELYELVARVEAAKDPTAAADPTAVDRARRELAEAADSPALLAEVRRALDLDRSTAELARDVEGRWGPGRTRIEIAVLDADRVLAARIANAAANTSRSAVGRKGGEHGDYEDWTKADLVKRAREIALLPYVGER